MSRSYKKRPYCKDHTRGMKKVANKVVRHQKFLGNGSYYKKVFCSYDISEYSFYRTFRSYVEHEKNMINFFLQRGINIKIAEKSDAEHYRDWYKMYKMK